MRYKQLLSAVSYFKKSDILTQPARYKHFDMKEAPLRSRGASKTNALLSFCLGKFGYWYSQLFALLKPNFPLLIQQFYCIKYQIKMFLRIFYSQCEYRKSHLIYYYYYKLLVVSPRAPHGDQVGGFHFHFSAYQHHRCCPKSYPFSLIVPTQNTHICLPLPTVGPMAPWCL